MKIKLYEILESKALYLEKTFLNSEENKTIAEEIKNKLDIEMKKDLKSFRAVFNKTNDLKEITSKIHKLFPETVVFIFPPGDNRENSKSRKYSTIVIKFTKNIKINNTVIPKNFLFYLVNMIGTEENGFLKDKQLSPDSIFDTSKSIKDVVYFKKNVKAKIESFDIPVNLKKFLNILIDEVYKNSIKNSAKEFKSFEDTIKLSKELSELFSTIHKRDIGNISRDFGEILSAIYLFKKFNFSKLNFPTSVGNKMTDFEIDGYKFSAKYKKGVSSSIVSVLDHLKENFKNINVSNKNEILKILEMANEKDSYERVYKMAQFLNLKIYKNIIKLIKGTDETNYVDKLQTFLEKKYLELGQENFKKFIKNSLLNKIYPSENSFNYILKTPTGDFKGIIIYALNHEIARALNSNKEFMNGFNKIANTMAIYQIYLEKFNKNKIIFKLKNFSELQFKFTSKVTSNEYSRGKMVFGAL